MQDLEELSTEELQALVDRARRILAQRKLEEGRRLRVVDSFRENDTRYMLETDKGQIVYVQNAGIRHAEPAVMEKLLRGETVDPKLVYFRTIPKFETAAPDLQWLTRAIFIGTGERYPDAVVIRFWRVE